MRIPQGFDCGRWADMPTLKPNACRKRPRLEKSGRVVQVPWPGLASPTVEASCKVVLHQWEAVAICCYMPTTIPLDQMHQVHPVPH